MDSTHRLRVRRPGGSRARRKHAGRTNVIRLPSPRRALIWLLMPFVLLPLVAASYVAGRELRSLDPISEAEAVRVGRQSETHAFTRLPHVHPVELPPPSGGVVKVAGDYVVALRHGRIQENAAYFDPNDGTVHVVSDELRLEATLPEQFQPTLRHALRHEFGHAFLSDLVAERRGRSIPPRMVVSEASQLAALPQESSRLPRNCPSELRAVIADYHAAPEDLYGLPYFTSTFGEYLAESYARVLEGRYVPPTTRAFFLRYAEPVG